MSWKHISLKLVIRDLIVYIKTASKLPALYLINEWTRILHQIVMADCSASFLHSRTGRALLPH